MERPIFSLPSFRPRQVENATRRSVKLTE